MSAREASGLDLAKPLLSSRQVIYWRDTMTERQCVANPRPLAGIGRNTVMECELEDSEEPESNENNSNVAIIFETIRMVEAYSLAH